MQGGSEPGGDGHDTVEYAANFPEIRDAGTLLAVHRARVRWFEDGRIRVDPIGNDPDTSLQEKDHKRGLAHRVACGYNSVDEPAGVQRLTWKGAILTAWKLSPPIKQIRLAWERHVARRMLGQLRSEEWIG